jgi:hypothetical protein
MSLVPVAILAQAFCGCLHALRMGRLRLRIKWGVDIITPTGFEELIAGVYSINCWIPHREDIDVRRCLTVSIHSASRVEVRIMPEPLLIIEDEP